MANQKFPEVGLRAVFELSGLITNWRKYQTLMRDIDRTTRRTTQKVNQATKSMTSEVARSFAEFARKSSIVKDTFDNLRPTAAIAEFQRLGVAFQDLGRGAQVNVTIFDHLVNSGVEFADAMRVAGGQVQFNLPLFDKLIQRGTDTEKAFQLASSGASGLGKSVTILGRSFSVMAIAVGASVAVLRISIKLISDSVSAYTELAEATRRLSFQTGLLTKEASSWVLVAKAAGVSTAASERAMTSFLKKVSELRSEQLANVQSTSNFARSMDFLKVTITDGEGTLKSTRQLLSEVNEAFQRLGSGARTTEAAVDLFGYSGRNLLPILVDQEQSLADMEQRFEDLGATLTALDKKVYAEFREANIGLKAALQGLYNDIARQFVPVLTDLSKWLTTVIGKMHDYNKAVRAGEKRFALGRGFSALEQARAAGDQETVQRLERILGIQSELAEEAEAAAQARADAAQELAAKVVESERKIREERNKTLQQLDDLKSQLSQKLADIERDAARRWEDILVNRMRDAIERAIRLMWRYEDLMRQTEQRRQDVLRDFSDREAELRRDTAQRLVEAERDAQDQRERLEREHQRRLESIRLKFLDTVSEAARRNDAVTVARAMRQRSRDLRDEQRRFQDSQADLEDSLAKKKQQIERDRQEREADHRRELARALERIDENHQRQVEEIERQTQRERILRRQRQAWELQDFNRAKARQLQDARRWYQRERNELAAHLNLTGQQLEIAYQNWIQAAAVAARQAAAVIAAAWANEIIRYQHTLTEEERRRSRGISMAEGGVVQASSPTTVVMGDAGPETGIFLPGRTGSMDVNHNFSRLGVDIEGLPGGINTQQAQALFYTMMVQFAKGIEVPRT
jgi:hypothetical protein